MCRGGGRPKQHFKARNQDVRSRRESRGTRRRDRAIAREKAALVRQEIFEVSEQGMPVSELADLLAIGASEVVKVLFMKGIMVQVNQACQLLSPPFPISCGQALQYVTL